MDLLNELKKYSGDTLGVYLCSVGQFAKTKNFSIIRLNDKSFSQEVKKTFLTPAGIVNYKCCSSNIEKLGKNNSGLFKDKNHYMWFDSGQFNGQNWIITYLI